MESFTDTCVGEFLVSFVFVSYGFAFSDNFELAFANFLL